MRDNFSALDSLLIKYINRRLHMLAVSCNAAVSFSVDDHQGDPEKSSDSVSVI